MKVRALLLLANVALVLPLVKPVLRYVTGGWSDGHDMM